MEAKVPNILYERLQTHKNNKFIRSVEKSIGTMASYGISRDGSVCFYKGKNTVHLTHVSLVLEPGQRFGPTKSDEIVVQLDDKGQLIGIQHNIRQTDENGFPLPDQTLSFDPVGTEDEGFSREVVKHIIDNAEDILGRERLATQLSS